jgi:hypothetical protein
MRTLSIRVRNWCAPWACVSGTDAHPERACQELMRTLSMRVRNWCAPWACVSVPYAHAQHAHQFSYFSNVYFCAANFSFAQLAKRKSLGRSKPATNSQAQALQHTVWNISTISKPYWTAFYRNKLSTTRCEWVRLFISWRVQSAYNSVRSRC